jgi:hypothetical protein
VPRASNARAQGQAASLYSAGLRGQSVAGGATTAPAAAALQRWARRVAALGAQREQRRVQRGDAGAPRLCSNHEGCKLAWAHDGTVGGAHKHAAFKEVLALQPRKLSEQRALRLDLANGGLREALQRGLTAGREARDALGPKAQHA